MAELGRKEKDEERFSIQIFNSKKIRFVKGGI